MDDINFRVEKLENQMKKLSRVVFGEPSLNVGSLRDDVESLAKSYDRLKWGVLGLFIIDGLQLVTVFILLVAR